MPGELCATPSCWSRTGHQPVRHTLGTRFLCGVGLVTEGCLRLEVHDHDRTGRACRAVEPGPDDEGGRGLLLVEQLSQAWGWTGPALTGGNAVWATLAD